MQNRLSLSFGRIMCTLAENSPIQPQESVIADFALDRQTPPRTECAHVLARDAVPRHHCRMTDLSGLMARHLATPFPIEVEKGRNYGLVDPGDDRLRHLRVGARRFQASPGSRRKAPLLAEARTDLSSSLNDFPATAQSYYELLVRLAEMLLLTPMATTRSSYRSLAPDSCSFVTDQKKPIFARQSTRSSVATGNFTPRPIAFQTNRRRAMWRP